VDLDDPDGAAAGRSVFELPTPDGPASGEVTFQTNELDAMGIPGLALAARPTMAAMRPSEFEFRTLAVASEEHPDQIGDVAVSALPDVDELVTAMVADGWEVESFSSVGDRILVLFKRPKAGRYAQEDAR
jgi:hypothetical protein